MLKLGEGIRTSTPAENDSFYGHAVPKLDFWFWYHVAPEFRHMLRNYEDRLSKYNFEKKIIFHKKGVELRGFDGNFLCPFSQVVGTTKSCV